MMPYNQEPLSPTLPSQAATFVDYGNLYSVLAAQTENDPDAEEFAHEILREVRRYLAEGDDTPTVLGRAYADFHALPNNADGTALLHALNQESLEPVFTSTEVQANASELRLCMDVVDTLAMQGTIDTVVIVTGNRPYLPLVRRIRERGRRALVAIVNPPHAHNGLPQGDADVYLDARNLLSRSSRDALLEAPASNQAGATAGGSAAASGASSPSPFYRPLTSNTARRTVEITEEYFGQYDEVYLTPLLRKLSDVLGDAHDPKALVSELEAAGAVRLEKREGYPYDYTVLIVNEDHPSVQEIHDDYYTGRSPFTYEEIAGTASSSAPDGTDARSASGTYEDTSETDDAPSASAADEDEPGNEASGTAPGQEDSVGGDVSTGDASTGDVPTGDALGSEAAPEDARSVSPYADRAPAEPGASDDAADAPLGDDTPSDVDAPSP